MEQLESILSDSGHQSILRYWESRRSGRAMPGRADIDPVDIPDLLPHIGFMEVHDSGRRFRYRLVGTRLDEVYGEALSGRFLDEAAAGPHVQFLHGLYADCARRAAPVYSESTFSYRTNADLSVKRLLLPLSNDGRAVDMVLFMNTFNSAQPMHYASPFRADDIVDFVETKRVVAGDGAGASSSN